MGAASELEVRLMDERRRRESFAGASSRELGVSALVELALDQREQPVHRALVAVS
jgi:hypothetical protein